MITRKAAIGFILLGILVFGVSSYDYSHRVINTDKLQTISSDHNSKIPLTTPLVSQNFSGTYKTTYRPPMLDYGEHTPLAMTAMMEIFVFCCYIILKRAEPMINAWAVRECEVLRESDSNENNENT